jgi:hypothetical protein
VNVDNLIAIGEKEQGIVHNTHPASGFVKIEGARILIQDKPALPTPRGVAPAYVALYGLLAVAAKACGYALAVHGSVQRDFDLLAVPWTDEAVDEAELIEALKRAVGGAKTPSYIIDSTGAEVENPISKPHGRRGWSIILGGGAYLDVSVMPKIPCLTNTPNPSTTT